MINFPFLSYKRTTDFLLLLLYISIIFLISPISFALFLSTICTPFLRYVHHTFKIPYSLAVLVGSVSFCYVGYLCIHWLIDSFLILWTQLQQYFSLAPFQQPLLAKLSTLSLSLVEQFALFFVNSVKNMFHYVLEVIIFLMAFYFSLFEGKHNPYWFFIYTPAKVRARWQRYYAHALQLFTTFLYVEIRLMLLTFLLLAGGFSLLDFSYPLQKALFIAIADCLPFFGIGIVLIPLAIYYYLTDATLLCIAIIILYLFIQTTRQLTESYLWASTFHMRTIHTFFISAASVYLFGFYGILLSPFLLLIAVKLRQHPIFER